MKSKLFVTLIVLIASASLIGAYALDVRAQGNSPSRSTDISYSGDDAYDPAAGGRPETSVIKASDRSSVRARISYSGDDAYDPAAGGKSALPMIGPAASVVSSADCGLSADEIAERRAMAVDGGFSGDDAYDPAAGGTPEVSLLAFADASSPMASCALLMANN